MNELQQKLFSLRDEKYREFNCRLIPTVDPETVIGVRTPDLRRLAKEIAKTPLATDLMNTLPHKYYEENNLHGFLIEGIKGFDECIMAINEFLPYMDNWATCDSISPKVFKKHTTELFEQIKAWLKSCHTYTVRFAVKTLMSFYLDECFKSEHLDMVAGVCTTEYYISMVVAWYFATALAKQYECALPYIENRRLDLVTHNRTIQKAVDSFRISDEQKAYLKTLRIKNKA